MKPSSRNGEVNAGNWMCLPHPNSPVLSHRLLNALRLYELSKSTESLLGMIRQAAVEVAELERKASASSETGEHICQKCGLRVEPHRCGGEDAAF